MMHTYFRTALVAPVAGLLALAAPAAAQLPNASAAALGVGSNFTASARGFNSVAWNPAGLGIANNPKVSFALMSFRGLAGLDPVTLGDLKAYEGEFVPVEVRQQWYDQIVAEGTEQGSAGTEITFLAASVGRVGLQISSSARASGTLGPGAAELLLFGNAGRTGQVQDIALAGSSFDVAVTTTGALSYAQPLIRTPDRSFAVGATVKYTFGHLVFTGEDQGGRVTANPLGVQLSFPVIVSDTVFVFDKLDNGAGVGVDLGAIFQTGAWSLGVAAKNVVNTFKWDEASLFYRPGEALFNADESESRFDPEPFGNAPASLQERVNSLVGQPEIAAGVAFQPNRRILLNADFRQRLEDATMGEPRSHLGAGLEIRPLSFLPVRVGGAILSEGSMVSGGLGLEFGVLNLTASAAQRTSELGTDQIFMFTFSSMRAP